MRSQQAVGYAHAQLRIVRKLGHARFRGSGTPEDQNWTPESGIPEDQFNKWYMRGSNSESGIPEVQIKKGHQRSKCDMSTGPTLKGKPIDIS